MRCFIVAEVDATELFGDENINWQYCCDYVPFQVKDACEFLLSTHLDEIEYFEQTKNAMRLYGCTSAFITAYHDARQLGAAKVLFYA